MIKKLIYILIFIFILGVIFYAFFSPQFFIQKIIYQNYNFIPKENLEIICHSLKGKSIFWAYLAKTFYNQKLLTSLPQIQKTNFKFKFPNTLILSITEKTPWALFILQNHEYFISEDGTLLNIIKNPDNLINADKVIFIMGSGLKNISFHNQHISQTLLTSIKPIINLIKKYFADTKLNIQINNNYDLTLLRNDFEPIILGNLNNLEDKFKRLKNFYKLVPTNKKQIIEYIDLRSPHKLIVKYRSLNAS